MSRAFRVFVFALPVVLVLAAVAAAQEDPAARLRSLSGEAFEIAFMQEMIVHHEMAVEMAKVAQERATRAELKTLADSIIAEQRKEIDQMTAWLRDWHGAQQKSMDHSVTQGAVTFPDASEWWLDVEITGEAGTAWTTAGTSASTSLSTPGQEIWARTTTPAIIRDSLAMHGRPGQPELGEG